MKKLSEIGRTRTPDILILALSTLDDEHENEKVTLLTPTERRELVREAIKKWERWTSACKSLSSPLTSNIDDFLEKENL